MGKQHAERQQPPENDADLDQRIELLLGDGPDAYSAEEWRGMREQLRLDLLYAGQFVAYCDHYEGEGDSRRLVRREVLGASTSLPELHGCLSRLSDEQQRGAIVSYIEPE